MSLLVRPGRFNFRPFEWKPRHRCNKRGLVGLWLSRRQQLFYQVPDVPSVRISNEFILLYADNVLCIWKFRPICIFFVLIRISGTETRVSVSVFLVIYRVVSIEIQKFEFTNFLHIHLYKNCVSPPWFWILISKYKIKIRRIACAKIG